MQVNSDTETAIAKKYAMKHRGYFDGTRHDIVARLAANSSGRVLEIGCGNGGTGAAALSSGKCAEYYAIELDVTSAAAASEHLTHVMVGDIEDIAFPWPDLRFDALILSEVLEHLRDPAAVLKSLSRFLRPGARIYASSPNVSHYRIILMQLGGEWRSTKSGPMDETHLRWFTPVSYQRMFEECGFTVESVEPLSKLSWKARMATLIPGVGWWLFATQIKLEARA